MNERLGALDIDTLLTDRGWALAEVGLRIDEIYCYIEQNVGSMGPMLTEEYRTQRALYPDRSDIVAQEAWEKEMLEALEHDGNTLNRLYALQRRLEENDDSAVDDWVQDHTAWWTEGHASPLSKFDETDY